MRMMKTQLLQVHCNQAALLGEVVTLGGGKRGRTHVRKGPWTVQLVFFQCSYPEPGESSPHNRGSTAYNDKSTSFNDGKQSTAYTVKITSHHDKTTTHNDESTIYKDEIKVLHMITKEPHMITKVPHIMTKAMQIMTIILRNRAEYRLILGRRGRRPIRLKSDDIPRD